MKWLLVLLTLGVVINVPGMGLAAETGDEIVMKPTPFSMDFFGFIKGISPGDKITVTDPDGVICGLFEVNKPGQYGFLHVYGDDPTTPADEGAVPGDILVFQRNGAPLKGAEARWQRDGQRQQLDFSLE